MRRGQLLLIVSWVGVAVSAGAFALALPRLLQPGGADRFVANVVGTLWTMAILSLAFGFTRTLSWRTLASAFFTGFYGVTMLATLVGTQAQIAFGADSSLAGAVLAPVTEELLKGLPVVIFVLLAVRSRERRPSIGDVVLFGAIVGAGFALYEDALYGRAGSAQWLDTPPLTFLFPSMRTTAAGGISVLIGGHIALTGLVAFGLGFGVLYRKRFRWAILAIPVTLTVAILAHMTPNQVALTQPEEAVAGWAKVTAFVTAMGYLVPILLLAGVGCAAFFETRLLRENAGQTQPAMPLWKRLLLLPVPEGTRRARALAIAQTNARLRPTPGAAQSAPPPAPPAPPASEAPTTPGGAQ